MELNLVGKLFLTSLGAWAVGKASHTKLRGSKQEIETVYQTMVATRKFQEELNRPGATIQSVMDKLHVKQMTEADFERVFNIKWPL